MDSINHQGTTAIQRAAASLSQPPCALPARHNVPLLSEGAVAEIVDLSRALLFPGYYGPSDVNYENIEYYTGIHLSRLRQRLVEQLTAALCYKVKQVSPAELIALAHKAAMLAESFIESLPAMRETLMTDVEAIFQGDPAAESHGEVILSYPGFKATMNHRIAHALFQADIPVIPRMISEMAHSATGIDIHPGATIDHSFMIDHGTGVVIGATAVIGYGARIYQGVTLGARSFPVDERGNIVKGEPRHPMLGNNVTIYANSTLLGRITVGDGAVIGGNLWVTEDVPAGARITQNLTRKS